jgi:hypothetical protein
VKYVSQLKGGQTGGIISSSSRNSMTIWGEKVKYWSEWGNFVIQLGQDPKWQKIWYSLAHI